MTAASPRLWVSRARPEAEATARRLLALGVQPVVEPVLEVVAIPAAQLDLSGADALAFTSQAAVAAFAAACPERVLRAFAVGQATAEAARRAGFAHVETPPEPGDVRRFARHIAERRPALVLNPTAEEPAADLAALLAETGVAARSVAVYRTVRTALKTAPAAIDGVLVHSAKAAAAIAGLVPPELASRLVAYAISDTVAASLRERGFGRILVAERPTEAALLERIEIDQTRPPKNETP